MKQYLVRIINLEEMDDSPYRIRYLRGCRRPRTGPLAKATRFPDRALAQAAMVEFVQSIPPAFRSHTEAEVFTVFLKDPPPVTPLEACIRIERLLRSTDTYHLAHVAMDREAKVGLAQWLKKVIKHAKAQR